MGASLTTHTGGRTCAPRRILTVAAVVALAVPLGAATTTAHAAVAKKALKISAKQFPAAWDRPGTTKDVVHVTAVPGVTWKVGGNVVDFGANKVKDVDAIDGIVVTAEATSADLAAVVGPNSWTLKFTDTALTLEASDATVTWVDAPGDKDSVIVPKKAGITWSIGTTTITPESFGKKTELAFKATTSTAVTADLLGATAATGSTFPVPVTNTLTSDSPTKITDATVGAALEVGDNPFDAGKGYGKGASIETVKVTGVAGLKWKIGDDAKTRAVKPGVVAYLPVDPADIADNGDLVVTPVPDKGYVLATSGYKETLKFSETSVPVVTAPASSVVKNDRGGATADTLVLKGARNMTWWFGQYDAKTKRYIYKAVKVAKDGNATYKVKHAKGATKTVVKVKAVADRGYVVTGTVVDQEFSAEEVPVDKGSQIGDKVVTLTETPGVDSWTVEDTVADSTVKTTVKRSDLVAAGVTSLSLSTKSTLPVVTPKYGKGYIAKTTP